jgi:purine-binding chemotaxis protein CheW
MNTPNEHRNAAFRDGKSHLEVLTFDLEGETFALEAGFVQEILDLLPETAVPGSPALVGAVVNFRGKVIPLADLHVAFGMAPATPTYDSRIIVIDLDRTGQHNLIGLKADKVHEVATLACADSEEPPRVGIRWQPNYVHRLVKRGETVIVIPDLDQIFSSLECASRTTALVSTDL